MIAWHPDLQSRGFFMLNIKLTDKLKPHIRTKSYKIRWSKSIKLKKKSNQSFT